MPMSTRLDFYEGNLPSYCVSAETKIEVNTTEIQFKKKKKGLAAL